MPILIEIRSGLIPNANFATPSAISLNSSPVWASALQKIILTLYFKHLTQLSIQKKEQKR